MSTLRDPVFNNKDVLSVETIKKYRIKCLEDISQDLVEYSAWDEVLPVATVSLVLRDGNLDQCIPGILGVTDVKRIDAKTVFGSDYRGNEHQVKIGKIELVKFRFRGSLVSDWLGPQEFPHVVQRPATSQVGAWRDLEQSKVEEDGGQELWLRAIIQPWTGQKLKLTIGILATKDATKVQDSGHHRYPFISLTTASIPVYPFPPENTKVCLPFIPYLVDDRDGEEDDLTLPKWGQMVQAASSLFKNNSAPHSKSNFDNLKEAIKGDWKAEKPSKYCYPELEVEDDDNVVEVAGMHHWHMLYSTQWVHLAVWHIWIMSC